MTSICGYFIIFLFPAAKPRLQLIEINFKQDYKWTVIRKRICKFYKLKNNPSIRFQQLKVRFERKFIRYRKKAVISLKQ